MLVELEGICAGYGDLDIPRRVSLTIGRGEIVGLSGANNAGKLTLVNCISRIVFWRVGSFTFEGRDISRMEPQEIAECGISQVPDGPQLFPAMTVCENLMLGSFPGRSRP